MPRNTRTQRWLQRWRRMPPWVKFTILTGAIVGLTGSITGVKAAWPVLRYATPATLVYVDGSIEIVDGKVVAVDKKSTLKFLDLQIDNVERSKRDEVRALNTLKLEQLKPQYKADGATRNIIDNSIQNTEDTIHKLEGQLRTLNRERRGQ